MVKKIFIILITIVALIIVGALVLNILLPNASKQLVNAVEDTIFKATGMSFDFNGDGDPGANNSNNTYGNKAGHKSTNTAADKGAGVQGFK